MTLKEIVTTAAGCVIIVVAVVLTIKAGEVFDGISKTASETQKTIDGLNLRRGNVYTTIDSAKNFISRLPGGG